MLDGKILAAVLATLTAVAVSTGQGVEPQNLEVDTPTTDDFSFQDIFDSPIKNLRNMFTETPEPENEVRATLQVTNLQDETLNLKGPRIVPSATTEATVGGSKVTSDSNIEFYGFEGVLKPVNSTLISGTVEGVYTSDVNISGEAAVSEELNSSRLEIRNVRESRINLGKVTGSIESGSSSTNFGSTRPLNINSFSGDILLYPGNRTVILDGRVSRLEAGDFTFGE